MPEGHDWIYPHLVPESEFVCVCLTRTYRDSWERLLFNFRFLPHAGSDTGRFVVLRPALFGRIAPVYDNLNDFEFGTASNMEKDGSLIQNGDRVLDLCCGSGELAFLLSEKVSSNGKVTGLDFSKEQLSMASHRQNLVPNGCYENIEWIEGDALDLPFPDGYFDVITMGYGLRNVVDKQRAMKEMFRVLKLGLMSSRVSVLDFNKSTQLFMAAIQEWMLDNVVVPMATGYGLAKEYEYLKSSIREFLTGRMDTRTEYENCVGHGSGLFSP